MVSLLLMVVVNNSAHCGNKCGITLSVNIWEQVLYSSVLSVNSPGANNQTPPPDSIWTVLGQPHWFEGNLRLIAYYDMTLWLFLAI